jgi:Carboxypeptidase regulatory-like domain
MKGLCLRLNALGWPVGSALLLLTLAGPTLAAATVSGTVKVPDGYSLDETTVTLSDASNHIFRVKTEDDGTYKLEDVTAGTYTLTVQSKGSELAPIENLVLTDGQTLKQDLTLTAAKPFCFVKAAAPIPLEDDINSASFADAPDIHIDNAAHLVEPVLNLPVLNQWGGPATVGGRFRVKYSSLGIHLAADLTMKVPGVNLAPADHSWQGNAIEFDFQNDPYDPARDNYDPDHNWQLIVGLGETPTWYLFGALNTIPMINGKEEPISKHILIKDRPEKDGQLVRIDIPWAIYQESDMTTLITPPQDGDLAAAEISIDYNNPESTKDATKDPLYQLTWSGLDTGFGHGNSLKPIQFCAQAP